VTKPENEGEIDGDGEDTNEDDKGGCKGEGRRHARMVVRL
jgi:hypothetical protein